MSLISVFRVNSYSKSNNQIKIPRSIILRSPYKQVIQIIKHTMLRQFLYHFIKLLINIKMTMSIKDEIHRHLRYQYL